MDMNVQISYSSEKKETSSNMDSPRMEIESTEIIESKKIFNKIEDQDAKKRVFKGSPELLKRIKLEDHDIFQPSLLSAAPEDYIAFYDYSAHKIVTYNVNMGAINLLGEGLGGGPKEFRNPLGLMFDGQGNIWVADPKQARLTKWGVNGEILASFSTDKVIPSRLVVTPERIITLSNTIRPKGVFVMYDSLGKKMGSFEKIDSDIRYGSFLIDGYLARGDNNEIFWGSSYYGMIRKYDKSGELLFSRSTIEKITELEFENVNIAGLGKGFRTSEDSKNAVREMAFKDGNLFVLFSGTKYAAKYLDVYDSKNGDYKFSFQLDQSTIDMEIQDEKIWVIEYFESTRHLSCYQLSG